MFEKIRKCKKIILSIQGNVMFMVIVMPSVTKVFPTMNPIVKGETDQYRSLGFS